MAQGDGGIENLAHAYRVLDVRWDASPRGIKASYRKLIFPILASRLPGVAAACTGRRISFSEKGEQADWKETYSYDDDPSGVSGTGCQLTALGTGDLGHSIFLF